MEIKKNFQNIFKTFFSKLFIFLYGNIKEFKDFASIDLNRINLENIKSDTFSEKKYYIYEIDHGRIYTDTVQNVAILKNNVIIPNVSFQQIFTELKPTKYNKVLKEGTPRIKKYLKGTIFSMVQGASGDNYFHFLFDIIPRLKLCEQKYPLDKIDFFYVPNIYEWQKKILLTFDIKEERLLNSKKYRHIVADKILAVDHPWYYKGSVHDEFINIPSWIVYWLREKFLNMEKKFNNNEKIFIDRSDSKYKHCQFQNNDELINFLISKGFKSYKVGQLDFFEQIYLFKNAKTIIGPHGASFANLIFCKPKTTVVEILPETHRNKQSWKNISTSHSQRISNILNLNYSRITTPEVIEQKKELGDIKFSIEEMDLVLKKII